MTGMVLCTKEGIEQHFPTGSRGQKTKPKADNQPSDLPSKACGRHRSEIMEPTAPLYRNPGCSQGWKMSQLNIAQPLGFAKKYLKVICNSPKQGIYPFFWRNRMVLHTSGFELIWEYGCPSCRREKLILMKSGTDLRKLRKLTCAFRFSKFRIQIWLNQSAWPDMSGQVNSLFFFCSCSCWVTVCHPHDVAERRPVLYVHMGHTQNPMMLLLLLRYFLSHGYPKGFFYHLPSVLKHRLTWASQLVSIGSKKCISIFRA